MPIRQAGVREDRTREKTRGWGAAAGETDPAKWGRRLEAKQMQGE